MNLTDLTEVLRERADLDDTAHDARMAGIRGRIVATRRRLALAGVVCVVLAVVSAVFLTVPREVEPANPPRSLPGFGDGARLVAQAWADLPTNSVTIEYTPKSDEFVLFDRCAVQGLVMVIAINERPVQAGGCHSGSLRIGDLAKFGAEVGKPLVITMVVGVGSAAGEFPEKAEDVRPPDEEATGEFALGVGEEMPVGEYPFPPRPETLEDVDHLGLSDGTPGDVNLRADRDDPDARQTTTMVWPGSISLRAALNTPGRLEVFIDDQAVYEVDSWNYEGVTGFATLGEEDGLLFAPGQSVTVTVIAERTTGDWIVQLSEYE